MRSSATIRGVLPPGYHDLFEITATVSGTLIGLLFVAVSVMPERLKTTGGVPRVKASAALTAFTNSLAVSLFALLPGTNVGNPALVVAILGLTFVAASLLSLIRVRHEARTDIHDLAFLLGLTAMFVVQLVAAIRALDHPGRSGPVNTIGLLVIACFFIGIARSWELMGGPALGLTGEIGSLAREARHRDEEPEDAEASES